jgi:hypothetical protein
LVVTCENSSEDQFSDSDEATVGSAPMCYVWTHSTGEKKRDRVTVDEPLSSFDKHTPPFKRIRLTNRISCEYDDCSGSENLHERDDDESTSVRSNDDFSASSLDNYSDREDEELQELAFWIGRLRECIQSYRHERTLLSVDQQLRNNNPVMALTEYEEKSEIVMTRSTITTALAAERILPENDCAEGRSFVDRSSSLRPDEPKEPMNSCWLYFPTKHFQSCDSVLFDQLLNISGMSI